MIEQNKYQGKEGFFYVLKFERAMKFGISTEIKDRLGRYDSDYPESAFRIVALMHFEDFSKARLLEKFLVRLFKSFRIPYKQEWVDRRVKVEDMMDMVMLGLKLVRCAYIHTKKFNFQSLITTNFSDVKLNEILERATMADYKPDRFKLFSSYYEKFQVYGIDPFKYGTVFQYWEEMDFTK